MRFYCSVFCTDQAYIGQIIKLLSVFDFVLEFANWFKIFNIWWWLSWRTVSFPVNWVNAKLDSTSTESTRCETPVNWVNVEWPSTSTESTRNDEILVNVGAFCIDSVDVESHSALTMLMWSLTPRWLSWQGVSLRIDFVDVKSHSALTHTVIKVGRFSEI
jgi:hypothetical protein